MINVEKAEKLYNAIKAKLKDHEGKIVAIEPDTGEYFIGDSALDACNIGKRKYLSKKFYLKRVGAKYTYVVGALWMQGTYSDYPLSP